jgi:hypothetical protein
MGYLRKKQFQFSRNILCFLAIVICALFFPASGLAVKFIIKPMVNVSSRTETNFFKTEKKEREVYTYLLAPGIQLGVETAKLKVLFNYTLEAYYYDDRSSVPAGEKPADDLNYVGHLAALEARYQPFRRLTLGIDESFYRTQYPTASDRLSESTSRNKYDINRLTPMVFYDFENRFSIGLRYRWTDLDYVDKDIDDSKEHRILTNLMFEPSRTTTFDLDYQHWALDYREGGPDYRSNQVNLIFQKRYKYFAFDAGAGYHFRSFEGSRFSDQDTPIFKLSVTGMNPPPREGKRYLGKAYLRPKSHILLSVERNLNNYEPYFTAHRFTVDSGHTFLEKIHVRLKGYYQKSDYETEMGFTKGGDFKRREDDTYNISGSIGYLFTERIALSLTGGIEDRDSNLADLSYEDKFFILKLDFNYDLRSRGGYTEESLYY